MTRDDGGRLVREAWIRYVQKTVKNPKPSHVAPWDKLSDWDKEADIAIYEAMMDHFLLVEKEAKKDDDESAAMEKVCRRWLQTGAKMDKAIARQDGSPERGIS